MQLEDLEEKVEEAEAELDPLAAAAAMLAEHKSSPLSGKAERRRASVAVVSDMPKGEEEEEEDVLAAIQAMLAAHKASQLAGKAERRRSAAAVPTVEEETPTKPTPPSKPSAKGSPKGRKARRISRRASVI